MNIAKSLKLKNILLKEIGVITQKIAHYNSTMIGSEVPYNTNELLVQLIGKKDTLVALKTALNKANIPIQESIYNLSELKSLITKLREINTKSGTVSGSRYSDNPTPTEYKAQITTIQLDTLVLKYEEEIDTLQEKIDVFNYTTQVEGVV